MLQANFSRTVAIFIQFFMRDIAVYSRRFANDLFNYALLSPIIFSVSFVYLQANIYFGQDESQIGTILFAGNILVPLMVVAYKITFELLFDLEKHRFIEYQITLLSPKLVILERIIFASLVSFIVCIPFFPVSKLILGEHLYTQQTSWLQLFAILFAGACCTASYHQFFASFLRVNQIGMFWVRINHILMVLAGAFVPITTINEYSPLLGKIIRLNPLLYLTEGIRQALLGSNYFLSFFECFTILWIATLFFIILTWRTFKKRVDHI